MKKLFLTTVILAAIMSSCTDNDDAVAAGPDQNYLPLADGNYWTYDVNGTDYMERDSLYVANDTTIGGNNYSKMKTRDLAFGFYSGTLANNGLRKQNGALLLSGNAGLNIDMFPIEVQVSDFVIFDSNASENQQLSTVSGTSQQTIENIPLNLSYTLSSTAGATLPVYEGANGIDYNNVQVVTIKLNMEVTATVSFGGFDIEVPVLLPQDVVVSQRYYAQNIGMVYSTTNITYNLQDFSGMNFTLPIPQSGNETQTETLISYNVD